MPEPDEDDTISMAVASATAIVELYVLGMRMNVMYKKAQFWCDCSEFLTTSMALSLQTSLPAYMLFTIAPCF